jgi:hypothetical protein
MLKKHRKNMLQSKSIGKKVKPDPLQNKRQEKNLEARSVYKNTIIFHTPAHLDQVGSSLWLNNIMWHK